MPETEILIIGGGIAGASAAYHLTQYGRHVTLLERGDIAPKRPALTRDRSGRSAGAICLTSRHT